MVSSRPSFFAAALPRAEARQQQLREIAGRNAQHGRLLVDQLLLDHVAGDLHRRRAGPLAVAGLQHEQLALFDRELDVLHVAVVLLEHVLDLQQLLVDRLVPLGHLVHRQRRADAGHDVFALGVDEELAVELVLAGGRVARERDAGARVVAHVAEDHRLHVHRRAQQAGDVLDLRDTSPPRRLHPALEHRFDRQLELLERVLRERLAEVLLEDLLVLVAQLDHAFDGHVGVVLDLVLAS